MEIIIGIISLIVIIGVMVVLKSRTGVGDRYQTDYQRVERRISRD